MWTIWFIFLITSFTPVRLDSLSKSTSDGELHGLQKKCISFHRGKVSFHTGNTVQWYVPGSHSTLLSESNMTHVRDFDNCVKDIAQRGVMVELEFIQSNCRLLGSESMKWLNLELWWKGESKKFLREITGELVNGLDAGAEAQWNIYVIIFAEPKQLNTNDDKWEKPARIHGF